MYITFYYLLLLLDNKKDNKKDNKNIDECYYYPLTECK